MPEDKIETSVSDADLDAAAARAATASEVKAEEPLVSDPKEENKPAEIKTEPVKEPGETDHQFRSRLGRRVSDIESKIDSFMSEMRSTMQGLNKIPAQPDKTVSGEEQYVSTADDVRRVLTSMEQEKKESQGKYDRDYIGTLVRLGTEEGLTDQELGRVENLLVTSFNKTYSEHKDPSSDAERNFLKAMRVLDKEKIGQPDRKVNLKGDEPKGTGINQQPKQIDREAPVIKLSKYAQEFVDYHHMTDDKVRKAMDGSMPGGLVRKA